MLTNPCFYVFEDAFCELHFCCPHFQAIFLFNKILINKLTKEICGQNPEYFMASLDVESLFTIIPLEETIKICCDSFYKNQELLSNISKNQFEKLFIFFYLMVSFINKLMG